MNELQELQTVQAADASTGANSGFATSAPASMPADPWATPDAAASVSTPDVAAVDPWGNAVPAADAGMNASAAGTDWLSAAPSPDLGMNANADAASGFQLQQLWDGSLPIEDGINHGLEWVVLHFRPFFQTVRVPIDSTLTSVEALLQGMPALAMIALIGVLAWQFAGRALALGATVSLLLVAMLGIWPAAMVTLSLVLTSLVFCLVVGLPLGILLASSDRVQRIARPLLDAMQTTPAFVYLVPVVMLFGIGNVPGVIVTIIFALPPLVRMTNLGIRQV